MSEIGTADQPAGLRERKKARTRAAIREHALRLFREQGYQATTVEQIAQAAEVSPATFYRYFPTKEDAVLQDDFDLLALEAFAAQPPGLNTIAAVRAAMADMHASLTPEELLRWQETTELTMAIPEVRARAVDELTRAIDVWAEAVAKRVGRPPDDPAARAIAGALTGVILSAALPTTQGGRRHVRGHRRRPGPAGNGVPHLAPETTRYIVRHRGPASEQTVAHDLESGQWPGLLAGRADGLFLCEPRRRTMYRACTALTG